MKYSVIFIIAIIIASCNAEKREVISEEPIPEIESIDSLVELADSLRVKSEFVDSITPLISESIKDLHGQLMYANEQKQLLEDQLDRGQYVKAMWSEPKKDDTIVASLINKVRKYEKEIADLRRRIYIDSILHSKYIGKSIDKTIINDKPGLNSLLVELDADGANTDRVGVYLIPYSSKAKRKLMQYEVGCDYKNITELQGKPAGYYNGVYFFNDVEEGKYIIKVCTYYGNYKVIKRLEGEQLVRMQLAPPVQ